MSKQLEYSTSKDTKEQFEWLRNLSQSDNKKY
jgi:hypothetical protein